MINNINYSNFLHFENLNQENKLKHFTTTISGGYSSDTYASFNLGEYSGDMEENVQKNRNKLADLLEISPEQMIFPYQTHSETVRVIDQDFLRKPLQEQKKLLNEVDALITNQKGICIGVTTADCVPVLLYDPQKHILAAIHAGWRGTVAKITSKTVQEMINQFNCHPENIIAGIGPSICQDCFEVGNEVVEAFSESGFSIQEIGNKNPETGNYHLDLWKANKLLLQEVGIISKNIEISGLCTVTHPELFFSARRQTIKSGRMITGGLLK